MSRVPKGVTKVRRTGEQNDKADDLPIGIFLQVLEANGEQDQGRDDVSQRQNVITVVRNVSKRVAMRFLDFSSTAGGVVPRQDGILVNGISIRLVVQSERRVDDFGRIDNSRDVETGRGQVKEQLCRSVRCFVPKEPVRVTKFHAFCKFRIAIDHTDRISRVEAAIGGQNSDKDQTTRGRHNALCLRFSFRFVPSQLRVRYMESTTMQVVLRRTA